MLKSIEIGGFKSFGKKVAISIDSPITAVVGPNGSGKSNVVEAIRFVLGEQSMKSLRGKGSSDLLFKGSKLSSPANKLKVSITFDNKKRLLNLSNEIGKNVSVDFDLVSVSRELYADGRSVYSIGGSEVRLKDVTDLLSSVHIGASGHHIISQGEADRLLTASNKERRSMIDDALGLRIYEIRIRDGIRKLEKAKLNIAETQSARRELAPHLNFLKKQVEKLNEAEEARRELSRRYFVYEKNSRLIIKNHQESIQSELFRIETQLKQYQDIEEVVVSQSNDEINSIKETLERINGKKSALLRSREALERQLGRTEGLIIALKKPKQIIENKEEYVTLSKNNFINFCEELNSEIKKIINGEEKSFFFVTESLNNISQKVTSFLNNHKGENKEIQKENIDDNTNELNEAIELEDSLRAEINKNIESLKVLEQDEKIHLANLNEKEMEIRSSEADKYKAKIERARLLGEKSKVEFDQEHLMSDIAILDEEKKIFEPFLINSLNEDSLNETLTKEMLVSERRVLERLRMKLEDIGGGSGGDIIKEFEDTKSRDEYLRSQLEDLENTIKSLLDLIAELRETVRLEFTKGIEKINTHFGEFFKAMFGGGNAFLSLVAELKKGGEQEDDLPAMLSGQLMQAGDVDLDDEDSISPKFERGVNIHVDLPNKKVKELTMLSGGERSLVSIALLFAMSQVNPPPFLVLDETDAALDEANSRRYGDMLERLSARTQLVVVTHNRETMSRAGTIYGVTMGADAVSKLLSIEFAEASKIAK